jgi:hypothetical protein
MRSVWTRAAVAFAAAVAVAAGATPARAGFINGGFETGDFTGWTVNIPALASVESNVAKIAESGSYSATEGTNFAYLNTGGGVGVYTIISQSFSVNAGTQLDFDVFFDAGDYLPFNDNGYANLVDANTNAVVATLWTSSVAAVGDYGSTPWTHVTTNVAAAGTYKLELGVTNVGDNILTSAIGVDNVNSVPAPAGALLFGVGLVSLGGFRAVRRKKVAA